MTSTAFFCGTGNCSYSGGTPPRIAIAILGVQIACFALFCSSLHHEMTVLNCKIVSEL